MYIHQQLNPAKTWTIKHGMSQHVILDVNIYREDGLAHRTIPKKVLYVNGDTVSIEFNSNQTGTVTVIGVSSNTGGDNPYVYGLDPSNTLDMVLIANNTTALGSGGSRSVISHSDRGKYQFRVSFDSSTDTLPTDLYFGIGENVPIWADPIETDYGDTVAITTADVPANTQLVSRFYNTLGETEPTVIDFFGQLQRKHTIDFILDLDDAENKLRVRIQDNEFVLQETTIVVPSGIEWKAFAYSGSNQEGITFDFVGATYTLEQGYKVWDDPT